MVLFVIGGIAGCGSSKQCAQAVTSQTVGTTAPTTTEATPTATTTIAPPASTVARKPKPVKPYQHPASFYIDAHASVAPGHIWVTGTTNLPESAVLTINAERAFKQTHGDERIDFLGQNGPTEDHVSVHDGHFSGELSSFEHDLSGLTQGDPGGPVGTVDPDADVCIILYTGRDEAVNGPWQQTPQVRADLGNYGGYLRGSPNVGTFGSLTKYSSLDMLASLRVPLDASALVQDLTTHDNFAPQLARLPNVCGP